jgi:hypothetical protein
VQIIEHEHDRPGARRIAQQRGDRVEEKKARTVGIDGGRAWQSRDELVELWNDASDVDGARAELGGERVRFGLLHELAQTLHPRPVGRSPARLPAAAGQDEGAPLGGAGGTLLGEPRLADPGLATQ